MRLQCRGMECKSLDVLWEFYKTLIKLREVQYFCAVPIATLEEACDCTGECRGDSSGLEDISYGERVNRPGLFSLSKGDQRVT